MADRTDRSFKAVEYLWRGLDKYHISNDLKRKIIDSYMAYGAPYPLPPPKPGSFVGRRKFEELYGHPMIMSSHPYFVRNADRFVRRRH